MEWDYAIFEAINAGLASDFLDAVLPVYRDKLTWVPLYAVIVILLWRSYGWRRTLYLLLCAGAVIGLSDAVAAQILKPWIGRLRPCADGPDVGGVARELVRCGGVYGFPSNHATNHFALAMVLSLTWLRGSWVWATFLWAASISVAQVYVGKHYPADILAGACLGMAVAILGVLLYWWLAGRRALRRM